MSIFQQIRQKLQKSQRRFAMEIGLSYKALQNIEAGSLPSLTSLNKLANHLGYRREQLQNHIDQIYTIPPDAIYWLGINLNQSDFDSWKIHVFNFVDSYRRSPDFKRLEYAPYVSNPKLNALVASVVEELCQEQKQMPPAWCKVVNTLPLPWFVSNMNSLITFALVESPLSFRKRNLFVLKNFMERL